MAVIFKVADKTDIPEILKMMISFNSIYKYPFDEKLSKGNLLRFLRNKELGRIWLIFEEEIIVGYVVLTFGFSFEYKGRDAFIDELFLKEAYRNKGIGKKTMEFLEKQASQLDLGAIHLEVERNNDKAAKLYTQQGYKDYDRDMLTKKFK